MRNFLLLTVTFPSILGGSMATWAQQSSGSYDGPHMWGGGWWTFLGPLMMFVFIAIIIAAIVFLVRWLGGSGHSVALQARSGRTPLEILKERFARGEIDKEEFEERRRVLNE